MTINRHSTSTLATKPLQLTPKNPANECSKKHQTDMSDRDPLRLVADRFAVAITPAMQDLIDPTDPNDPLAKQFLPDARELHDGPDELTDPIGDASHSPVTGIVHRYPDRLLLTPIRVCPVYCRLCLRREQVGSKPDSKL
jgi:lysine 2,3-aminomutase